MERNREDFEEKFSGLLRLARQHKGCVTSPRLNEFTGSFGLDEEESKLVRDVLEAHHIGVDETIDPGEYLRGEDLQTYRDLAESYGSMVITDEKEIDRLLAGVKNNDKELTDRLILSYLSMALESAALYSGEGLFLEDLLGDAEEAIVTAVGDIDVNMPSDMLGDHLKDAVLDRLDEVTEAARKQQEEDEAAVRYVEQVAEKAAELSAALGRSCTVDELADETGWTSEYILEAVRISGDEIEDINTSGIDLYGREARARADALFNEAKKRLMGGDSDE